MLLAFTFILLSIGVWILVSVYSIFFPFIKNLGEIGNYNTAYYGAISSVERWELALKYRGPGFEGSGGYVNGTDVWWPQSDTKLSWENFGFVGIDPNGMRRHITSRTNSVPNPWAGNVEYLLAGTGSTDYNMLNYATAEKIILSYDDTTDEQYYYADGGTTQEYDGTLTWTLRLPPKVVSGFNGAVLCDTCDLDDDGLWDDVVGDRSMEGYKNGMYFKIVPNVATLYYSGSHVDQNKDIATRESVINDNGDMDFGDSFNPISKYTTNDLTKHVVIANNPGNITETFEQILLSSSYTWLSLHLWLINLLKTVNGDIYPFLEYKFTTINPISDRFYTIQGNGRVGEYDVQVVVKKPTSQWSIAWSFTVIF